jgi:hypothetical protein
MPTLLLPSNARAAGLGLALVLSSLTGCSADPEPTSSDADAADEDALDPDGPSGGGSVTRQDGCAAILVDAPVVTGAVDVIWLIDTSASMVDELAEVQANIAAFMQQFDGSRADARLVVITALDPAAGTPLASDPDHYRFVPALVDSKALYSAALTQFPNYQDFLRLDAHTQFVMVSDDDDALPAEAFKQQMEALLGAPFTQHAVASESVNGEPCQSAASKANPICSFPVPVVCAAAAVGATYYELAELTGGEQISICADDWSQVFGRLESAVIDAVPLPCVYPLAQLVGEQPDITEVQVVYTDGDGNETELPKAESDRKCGKARGWYYDDERDPVDIMLCPAACELVARGGAMDIGFGCPPILL